MEGRGGEGRESGGEGRGRGVEGRESGGDGRGSGGKRKWRGRKTGGRREMGRREVWGEGDDTTMSVWRHTIVNGKLQQHMKPNPSVGERVGMYKNTQDFLYHNHQQMTE